jgi:hypothetical protein
METEGPYYADWHSFEGTVSGAGNDSHMRSSQGEIHGEHTSVPLIQKKLRTSKKANTILASANKALAEKLARLQQLLQEQHDTGNTVSMTPSESEQWRRDAREKIQEAYRKQKLAEDSREVLQRKLQRYKDKLRSFRDMGNVASVESAIADGSDAVELIKALQQERRDHELCKMELADALEANDELGTRLQELEEEKRHHIRELSTKDKAVEELEFALATAEDLVRALAQEGKHEASAVNPGALSEMVHGLFGSFQAKDEEVPSGFTPYEQEYDALEILVSKHEELEAGKSMLEQENQQLTDALAKESLYAEKALEQSATFKQAMDLAQNQAKEALREWETAQMANAKLEEGRRVLEQKLQRLEAVNRSLNANIPRRDSPLKESPTDSYEHEPQERTAEAATVIATEARDAEVAEMKARTRELQAGIILQQREVEEERLRMSLRAGEQQRQELELAARESLVQQQQDQIAAQKKQLETFALSLSSMERDLHER